MTDDPPPGGIPIFSKSHLAFAPDELKARVNACLVGFGRKEMKAGGGAPTSEF